MTPKWKSRLMRVPGAGVVKAHLLRQGHSEQEAETGGLAVAWLVLFLSVLAFNGFVLAAIRTFFVSVWNYCSDNPTEAIGVGIFGTALFLALLFKALQKSEGKKAALDMEERMNRHRMDEKKQRLGRGAMGNFEEVFRHELSRKYPDIAVLTVRVTDTTPRIRFQAQRFTTEFGGKTDKNYQLFRDNLLSDSLHVVETAFGTAENIQSVIVDGVMKFIDRAAKFYDGPVLSLKAQREVLNRLDVKVLTPFKVLSSFDLRYQDGMEVPPIPEEESKTARVIERMKENAPRLNVRYETAREKVDDGWERAEVSPSVQPSAVAKAMADKSGEKPAGDYREGELSAMPPSQFQDVVTGLLSKMGFSVQKVKKVPGGTIQVLADLPHPVLGGSFFALARQYPPGAPIHADLVRELDELTREDACKRGIYLVTGSFTEEARNIALKLAVDLVDGRKMTELLAGPPFTGAWTFRLADEKGVQTDLSRMPLLDFQQEVDQFLKSMGFRVAKIRRAPGGSVIAVVEHPHPLTGGKFAVLAKQYPEGTKVPAEMVSEFSHVMKAEFCHRGLLMATSELSMEARALSRFSGVDLVDRNLWENLRRRRGLGDEAP